MTWTFKPWPDATSFTVTNGSDSQAGHLPGGTFAPRAVAAIITEQPQGGIRVMVQCSDGRMAEFRKGHTAGSLEMVGFV